jgi:hypothetical protein
MKRFLPVILLTIGVSAAAQTQTVMIEGHVYSGVEGGCWMLDDVYTGRRYNLYGGGPDLYQSGVWAIVWGYPRDWYTLCMEGIPFEVVEYQVVSSWWWPPDTCSIVPDEAHTDRPRDGDPGRRMAQ